MKIFLHADDVGSTRTATERNLAALESGLLNSFSIIANGNGCDLLSRKLTNSLDRNVRIAVHLNLTEGRALSRRDEIPLLTDSEGYLKCAFTGLLIKWLLGPSSLKKSLLEQIEKEWRAQILQAKNLCAPHALDAIDSHIHIHMLPFLFPIAARLAAEQKISEIRISSEVFHLSHHLRENISRHFFINLIKHVVLRICSMSAKKIANGYSLRSPETVLGILFSGRMTCESVEAGIRAAQKKRMQSVEVIFHIGRADNAEIGYWKGSPAYAIFPLSEARDREYNELMGLKARFNGLI